MRKRWMGSVEVLKCEHGLGKGQGWGRAYRPDLRVVRDGIKKGVSQFTRDVLWVWQREVRREWVY